MCLIMVCLGSHFRSGPGIAQGMRFETDSFVLGSNGFLYEIMALAMLCFDCVSVLDGSGSRALARLLWRTLSSWTSWWEKKGLERERGGVEVGTATAFQ